MAGKIMILGGNNFWREKYLGGKKKLFLEGKIFGRENNDFGREQFLEGKIFGREKFVEEQEIIFLEGNMFI